MLVLTRKVGEAVFFPEVGASVKIIQSSSKTVKMGIEAPKELTVLREEVETDKSITNLFGKLRDYQHRVHNANNTLHVVKSTLEVVQMHLARGEYDKALEWMGRLEETFEEHKKHDQNPELVSSPSMLLVEDNLNERALLTSALEMLGFEIVAVASGEEAIEEMKKNAKYDIILTDLHLPQCSGYDVAKYAEEHSKTSKVVVISGDTNGHKADSVHMWLNKPIGPREIVERLIPCLQKAA